LGHDLPAGGAKRLAHHAAHFLERQIRHVVLP
jgi:hypothetical protein